MIETQNSLQSLQSQLLPSSFFLSLAPHVLLAPGFEVSDSMVIFRRHFWLISDMSPSGLSSLWLTVLHSPWLTSSSSHRLLKVHEQKDATLNVAD